MVNNINYEKFLKKHDMLFKTMPKAWYEAPFIGNGSTGVVAYFDEDNDFYLNLGDTDIYDNRTGKEQGHNDLFLTPRLPLGGFKFKSKNGFSLCDLRLSLYNGEFFGEIGNGNKNTEVKVFTAESEKAFFFEFSDDENFSVEYMPAAAISPRQYKMVMNNDSRACPCYEEPKKPHTETQNGITAHIQPKFNGGEYRVLYKVFSDGEKKTLVCLVENDEAGEKSETGFEKLVSLYENREKYYKEHLSFWHGFYKKSFVSFDDDVLESFYWIQLYKCAAATRSGCHVYDTTGPWMEKSTSWPGGWWNLNVQLHYSLLYPSNHTEIGESLIETLQNGIEELRENVPEEYRNGKFCTMGRNTTRSMHSPAQAPGTTDDMTKFELGNLVWALHNCYVHLESMCDEKRIKEFLFPLLKNSVEYMCIFLFEGEDGKYHLLPTVSPEYLKYGYDCSYNLSLIEWGLFTLLRLNEKYKMKDGNDVVWQYTLEKLAPLPVNGDEGIMIAADVPYSESHRHYSHLLGFYPLHRLDERDEKTRTLIENSVSFWQSKPEGLQGYSQSGASSMYAYLGNGNKAYKHLLNLFDGFIQKNTMYYEDGGPVLETPPAAARSILDMMFISTNDEIRIFTGTPDKWQNVSYCNLLAENGCKVSAKRVNGKLTFLEIEAKTDCVFGLHADVDGLCKICGEAENQNGFNRVTLKSGEKIIFKADDENGEMTEMSGCNCNCFGV